MRARTEKLIERMLAGDRVALAKRLGVPEARVLSLIEDAGFTPFLPLNDADLFEILRSLETLDHDWDPGQKS